VSLHGKKRLGKKDRKKWHYDKILVHLKKYAPDWGTKKDYFILNSLDPFT